MATIALEGMHFYAYHGFYEEEQLIGNHYYLDVYIETNIGRAAAADDLYSTINYEIVYFICQSEMRKPTRLLETLVQSIADRISGQFEKAGVVRVRLKKMNPPLGGEVACAYVEHVTGAGGGLGAFGAKGGGFSFGDEEEDEDDDDDMY